VENGLDKPRRPRHTCLNVAQIVVVFKPATDAIIVSAAPLSTL